MKITFKLSLLLFLIFSAYTALKAQNYLLDNISEKKNANGLEGIHIYKIVVLPFRSQGLSVSTAFSFSKKMGESLINTNRFEVIGPEEVENYLIEKNSPLLGCVEISCGVQISKELNAQYLLVNNLSLLQNQNISLQTKLVEVQLNKIEFEDFLYFKEDEINSGLFTMPNRIIRHVPLVGNVVQSDKHTAVVSLGRIHNINVGDQMVIYKQEGYANSSDLPFETTLNKTRAIIKINRVAENASEGAITYNYELPDPRDKVKAILNVEKQVRMVAQARREIDDAFKVHKEEKLDVVIPVSLKDKSRHEWLQRYNSAKNYRNILNISMIGSGLLTTYFYFQDGISDTKTLGGLGATALLGYFYINAHYALDTIIEEGRYKEYIENSDVPLVTRNNEIKVPIYRFSYNF